MPPNQGQGRPRRPFALRRRDGAHGRRGKNNKKKNLRASRFDLRRCEVRLWPHSCCRIGATQRRKHFNSIRKDGSLALRRRCVTVERASLAFAQAHRFKNSAPGSAGLSRPPPAGGARWPRSSCVESTSGPESLSFETRDAGPSPRSRVAMDREHAVSVLQQPIVVEHSARTRSRDARRAGPSAEVTVAPTP